MSTTVDERVVELGFNNKEFEQGVKTSTKTLNNLKKDLNFDESAKGLSNLSAAGKKFSLAGMAEGVSGISNRFSTLGIVGMTIIQNLTNAAIQYGKKLVSSIMEPMKQGFQEYETQMNAIQTVLANTESKGTTLEDVGAALDELNTYADKTIYNFTEMTRNIGTFTAAGVDLETSVDAIKGIANLAAVSGSNSQQASTAMYQLSQALSSGTVKLMDWNSVVNAGMGGQVFQDALKDTARVSGIAIDDLIDKHGSFRETLSTGWLSSEVLLQTLSKFTGDLSKAQLKTMGYNEEQIEGILKLGQTANDAATKVKTFTQLKETLQEALGSGWTKTWQLILGDFEEAKTFFTEISDVLGGMIGASSDSRNAILTDWKKLAGRAALIQTLRNAFDALLTVLTPIKEAFTEIFPPITGLQLANLTMMLLRLSERLILSSENADRVKRIFAGVFSVFAMGIDAVKAVAGALWDFVQVLYSMSGADITGGGILEFLAGLGDQLVALRDGVDFKAMGEGLFNGLYTIMGYLHDFKYAIITGIDEIRKAFTDIFEKIDTSKLEGFFDKFEGRFRPFETLLKAIGLIIGGILSGAAKLIPGLFKVAGAIGEFVGKLGSMIVDALSNVNFVEMFDVINAGLISAILLAITNFINKGSGVFGGIEDMFEGVADVLDEVGGALEAWQQNLKSKTLLNIALAVGILAVAMIALASVDSVKLTIAIGIMTGMFLQLIGAQAAFSKVGGIGGAGSIGLLGMAAAMLIMAGAISILAKLDKADMEEALGMIYAVMAGMLILSKFMGKNGPAMVTGSLGMIAVAGAMLVLSLVIKKLGEMDPDVVIQGLKAAGAMLAGIAVFMRVVDDKGVSKGLGLLAMAGAVLVLAQVVKQLGAIDPGILEQGLIGIAAILGAIAIFTRVSGGGKGMIATALGVTILSGAMIIFVDVIAKLGKMDPEKLGIGLAGMAAALLIIAVAVRALPKNMILQAVGLLIIAGAMKIIAEALEDMGDMTWEEIAKGLVTLAGAMLILSIGLYAMTGTLAGSFALLMAAAALAVLTPVLVTLGGMPLTEIGLALLALAGVFVVLGVAGLVLTPIVPTLLMLGVAMLGIGAGAALVGLGLLMFSTGLLALAAGGAAAAVGIVAFVTTLLSLLPIIIKTLIDTLIVFAKGIQKAAPEVGKAITALMLAFLQVIIDTAPKIFETLDVLIKGLIQLIVDNVPEFVAAVVLLLLTILEEIALKMPDFLAAGFTILIEFLKGIRDNIAEVVTVVIEITTEFIGAVAEKLPEIIQSGWDLMIAFIDGMATGIDENMQPALDAIGRLGAAIIAGLVTALETGSKAVVDKLVALVMRAWLAAKKAIGFDSPAKLFIALGKSIPQGIIVGILKLANNVEKAVVTLKDKAVVGMKNATTLMRDVLDKDLNFDPVIRPVLDMSALEDGTKTMNEMFGPKTLAMMPALVSSSRIAAGLRQPLVDSKGKVIHEGATITFEQNLHSPTPLSRFEIYRQTNNQLQALKGMVKP